VKKNIIEVNNLYKEYYQYKVFKKGKLLTKALNNISFKVKEGDFFGLLGQNGAGKTTLLKLLTTNLKKTAGSIHIDGIDIEENIRKVKPQISWMFGVDYEGYGWSSIERNLKLAAYYLGMTQNQAEKRIKELLEYFGLYHKRKLDVWRMSAGMQAKYSLAAAMLKKPKILFLDEPLLGLDVPAKDMLRNFLVELNKEGTTIVYTDHQLQEMEKVCNNLIIIEQGNKVYDGSLDTLKQQYRDTHVLGLTCQSPTINKALLGLTKKLKMVTDYEILDSNEGIHELKIYTKIDSKKALLPVGNYLKRNKVIIERLNAGLLSLEDVFKKFLKKNMHSKTKEQLQGFHKTKEEPLPRHTTYLKHKHHDVREAACQLLHKKKQQQVERVLRNMSKMSKPMQISSLNVIGNTRNIGLLQRIKKHLQTRDKDIQVHLTIAQAKIGDTGTTTKLLHYLLAEKTTQLILSHLPHFHKNVLSTLSKFLHKLNRHDLGYLIYQIEKSKYTQALYNALDIKYKEQRNRKTHMKQTKMIIHGKVR